MQTKLIIFDKDGTLLDFDSFWISVTEYAIDDIIKYYGADAEIKNQMLEAIGINDGVVDVCGLLSAGTYSQIAEALENVLKLKGVVVGDDFENIAVSAFNNNTRHGNLKPTCKNIEGVFDEITSHGIKVAVVTTDDKPITEECLEGLNIRKYFSYILTDDGIYPSKPNPYYIDMICEKESLSKDEIVMVGDTPTDMKFAANGGIKAIGVSKTEKGKSILKAYTDNVLDDISYVFETLK